MNKKFIQQTLNYILLIIPILLIIYLGFNIIQAVYYAEEYSIDFREENFKNENLPLYINEDYNSNKFKSFGILNGVNYAEINYSPISFIFQPEEFPLNKEITFSAEIQGQGDWEITTVCEECPKNEKYNWQPFYSEKLANNDYQLVKYIDGLYIYSLEDKKWENANNIDDWILKNIPKNSSLEIIGDVYDKSKLINPNIDYIPGSYTEINNTLRGNHTFFIYLKDNIELEIEKQDLNWYNGTEDIFIEIYDNNENLVFKEQVEDDGISKNNRKLGNPIIKKYQKKIKKEGIYMLKFLEKKYSKSDWIINKIKINTNKIITTDKILSIKNPTNLYTETVNKKTIGLNFWHTGSLQNINITNNATSTTTKLTPNEINKNIFLNLETGHNTISYDGGIYLWGAYFSFEKDNFFYPYSYNININNKPLFIISNFHITKNSKWTHVNKKINHNLHYDKETKNIKLIILNNFLNQNNKFQQKLFNLNLIPISNFNEFILYGKKIDKIDRAIFSKTEEWLQYYMKNKSVVYHDNIIDYLIFNKNKYTFTNKLENADYVIIERHEKPTLIKNIKIKIN